MATIRPNDISGYLTRQAEQVGKEITQQGARIAVAELKTKAPYRTGSLRRSVRAKKQPNGDYEILMEDHGVYQNRRGPHRGWLDRAVTEVRTKILNAAQARR